MKRTNANALISADNYECYEYWMIYCLAAFYLNYFELF